MSRLLTFAAVIVNVVSAGLAAVLVTVDDPDPSRVALVFAVTGAVAGALTALAWLVHPQRTFERASQPQQVDGRSRRGEKPAPRGRVDMWS